MLCNPEPLWWLLLTIHNVSGIFDDEMLLIKMYKKKLFLWKICWEYNCTKHNWDLRYAHFLELSLSLNPNLSSFCSGMFVKQYADEKNHQVFTDFFSDPKEITCYPLVVHLTWHFCWIKRLVLQPNLKVKELTHHCMHGAVKTKPSSSSYY